jgi:hypothetical protein
MVPDFGAEEVYIVRRAKDMSIYFLRFRFGGKYRGAAYAQRREFFSSAASIIKCAVVFASRISSILDKQSLNLL